MSVPQMQVDLRRPPAERWTALHTYLDEGRQLLAQYATDLGGIAQFHEMIGAYRDACIDTSYVAELAAIARMIDATPEDVLVVNLYYDMIKFVLGCTAFAVDTAQGPLHARNLDWWTDNELQGMHLARWQHHDEKDRFDATFEYHDSEDDDEVGSASH